MTLGGNRRQSLSDGSVQQLLPALTVSPASIDLGSNITWSPGLSLTNNTSSKTPLPSLVQLLPGGLADTIQWYLTNQAWWRPQKADTEAKYAIQGQ